MARRRAQWPLPRDRAAHAHEARVREHGGDMAIAAGLHREAAEDLLVLDALRTRRADALQDEIEAVVLVVTDAVVIDRGAQVLTRTGRETDERQRLAPGPQRNRGRARAVRDAHHDCRAPAVLEILFEGVTHRRGLPEAAEEAHVFREAANDDGRIDRALECAADESSHARAHASDRVSRSVLFCNIETSDGVGH